MITLALAIVSLGVYAWYEIGHQARRAAQRERLRLKRSIAALEHELLVDEARQLLTNYHTIVRNPYEFSWEPGAIWEVEDHAAVRALSTV